MRRSVRVLFVAALAGGCLAGGSPAGAVPAAPAQPAERARPAAVFADAGPPDGPCSKPGERDHGDPLAPEGAGEHEDPFAPGKPHEPQEPVEPVEPEDPFEPDAPRKHDPPKKHDEPGAPTKHDAGKHEPGEHPAPHDPCTPAPVPPPAHTRTPAFVRHGVRAGTGGAFGGSVTALVAGGVLIAGALGGAAYRLRRTRPPMNG